MKCYPKAENSVVADILVTTTPLLTERILSGLYKASNSAWRLCFILIFSTITCWTSAFLRPPGEVQITFSGVHRSAETIFAPKMPPQHPYAGDFPKSGSEEHENNVTIQDADNGGFSTAAFTHISSFIESLDDMLAGESENPTHEPYDEQFTAQAYAPLELDPATAV